MSVPLVTVDRNELAANGYREIVSQDGCGEVILRNALGGLEVFAVRDDYAGFCLDTEDGRVLEFCRSAGCDGCDDYVGT